MPSPPQDPESNRLRADQERVHNWKRWGPYLAERQWGTVREDYSEDGSCWDYFTHDHARSRAYRWGEDGLLGFTDRQARIALGVALWNGQDPFLKERLFGLTGPQGNHSEDVKEEYFYLRSTPTHSYMKALYKYPHQRFPYAELLGENQRRSRLDPEYELADTGIFEKGHFDVVVEFAKADAEDVLLRWTATNHGQETAVLHLLPQIWFRNVWSWEGEHLSGSQRPTMAQVAPGKVELERETLGKYTYEVEPGADFQGFLFTENSTNYRKLYGAENHDLYVKDAFHDYVVNQKTAAVNPALAGTKAAAHFILSIPPGESAVVRVRFRKQQPEATPAFADFDAVVAQRAEECAAFFANVIPPGMDEEAREVSLQAYAGLLWSKQFYYYPVARWLPGDPARKFPAEIINRRRNTEWSHLFARDVISMPDKWEYPWFAAWDLAFHMVPMARIDPGFAKKQLTMLLREWYMHPNGQIPAYEFSFSDVNPPVHAWAAWRVYEIEAERTGVKDRAFLAGVFQKLLVNFTWWVNRKDSEGQGIFAGGFLGLDNIGIFDRNEPDQAGGRLQQADATAWMAFYSACMLRIALELSWDGRVHPAYQDMASKFLAHFLQIVDAVHSHGGTGLWDELDGFYYDHLATKNRSRPIPLKSRSLVGLLPLVAVEVLDAEQINHLPEFKERFEWHLKHWPLFSKHIVARTCDDGKVRWLVALASREHLLRVLRRMTDQEEFLSDYGIRSLSRAHRAAPFRMELNGEMKEVRYDAGDATTSMFGGNSNWRGPVWFPINHLLIEALERYHKFFGSSIHVEYPSNSGHSATLQQVANDLKRRHSALFLRGEDGRRPCHGQDERYAKDPAWRDLLLFHEFFHGDHGRGHGASHQTGWTALVTCHLHDLALAPSPRLPRA